MFCVELHVKQRCRCDTSKFRGKNESVMQNKFSCYNYVRSFLQAYLHSHNRPHLSLHEEMVRREREREREERRRQQEEIEASRLREKKRVQL